MTHFARAFSQAWMALMERKTRTFLSITGVCVGVFAVLVLSMIAESGKQKVFQEFETYGLNTIWIYRFWEDQTPGKFVRQGSGISSENLSILRRGCCPSVKRISPNVYLDMWIRQLKFGNNFTKSSLQGVGEDFFDISHEQFIEGRGFNAKDIQSKRMVAVIGPKTKESLFGPHKSALGNYIRVDGHRYMVIGVLAAKDRSVLDSVGATQGVDINSRMIVPYTSYQVVLGSRDIHTLIVEAISEKRINTATSEIISALSRIHNNHFRYTSQSMLGWINTANEIIGSISIIGISAAMVSLLVGGIGIYNVMSSAVTERTREIGIRKAIGARDSDIRRQFLFEALVVGILGTVFGCGLAAIFGLAIFAIYQIVLLPSWLYLFTASFSAIAIAALSGLKPAIKAASKPPVDALRYE